MNPQSNKITKIKKKEKKIILGMVLIYVNRFLYDMLKKREKDGTDST